MSYQVEHIRRARSVRSTHSRRIPTSDKNISVASQKPDEIFAVSTAFAHSSTLWPTHIARNLRFSLVLHILVFLVGIFSPSFCSQKSATKISVRREEILVRNGSLSGPSSPSLYSSHPLLFARFAPDRYRRHP